MTISLSDQTRLKYWFAQIQQQLLVNSEWNKEQFTWKLCILFWYFTTLNSRTLLYFPRLKKKNVHYLHWCMNKLKYIECIPEPRRIVIFSIYEINHIKIYMLLHNINNTIVHLSHIYIFGICVAMGTLPATGMGINWLMMICLHLVKITSKYKRLRVTWQTFW